MYMQLFNSVCVCVCVCMCVCVCVRACVRSGRMKHETVAQACCVLTILRVVTALNGACVRTAKKDCVLEMIAFKQAPG